MGVIYRYLSSALVPLSDDASSSSSSSSSTAASRLKNRVYRLFPSTPGSSSRKSKADDLSLTCVKSHDLLCNSLLFAIHYETVWWIRLNVSHYRRDRPLILPRIFDWESVSSWIEWKLYWQRFKTRVWPAVFEYQTTLSIMYFLQVLASMVVSEDTMFRLTQHPYQRALVVSQSGKDRVTVGTDSFMMCLWCNSLFFTASYAYGQMIVFYNYHHNLLQRMSPSDAYRYLIKSSWRLGTTMVRRYYLSALGAGIGSTFWPGVGTILGMGLGDGIAELTPEPALPDFGKMRRLARSMLKQFSIMLGNRKNGGKGNSSWLDDSDHDSSTNPYKAKNLDDELMCGCCQTTMFSADPRCPERAPVSSRECSHTICKRCVEQCHLALMERTQTYQEWISCPICKATNAFSSHNYIINRSLCGAIAVMERRQSLLEEQLQQKERQQQQPSTTKPPPS